MSTQAKKPREKKRRSDLLLSTLLATIGSCWCMILIVYIVPPVLTIPRLLLHLLVGAAVGTITGLILFSIFKEYLEPK